MKKYLVLGAALLACAPAMAFAQDAEPVAAQDFDGIRLEARLGYETPTISDDDDVYKIGSAASYGGEIGFDIKAGNKVVVGPYATYEFSSVKLCDGGVCLKEDGNLGAGARIGFVASPKVLVYGKIGYARIKFSASVGTASGSESQGGVQGALGVNVNFGKNAYGLLEINYGDYGDFYGVGLQRRQALGGVGVRF
jgi:outer membrane immunogenic protein